jgi:hypothetical protein
VSTARGWTPTLRYSPVNHMIINWGINGQAFDICCLPKPKCEGPTPVPPTPDCGCGETPIIEPVDTYDWHRWVPEIIVGFAEASEDMAATYARRAAREFAIKARVLKRQIYIRLQPGVYRYPVEAFADEDVQGVNSIESAQGMCSCECNSRGINIGHVSVNVAKQEIQIAPTGGSCGCHVSGHGPEHLLVTVWSAPTEDSCKHDVFLYEQYRREITLGARADFLSEVQAYGSYKTTRGYASFRGDQMMFNRADKMKSEFVATMRKARVAADTDNEIAVQQPGPLFASGCCAIGARR